MSPFKRSGFTLIELSIVLVIIGLIIGAIMLGQVLIKAAKIRSAVTQLQHYSSAYNAFELKYGCIMGDCRNATDFFGTTYVPAGSYAACTTATNGIGNGDGNGSIDNGGSSSWLCESLFAIRSLRLANLLGTTLLNSCANASTYMFNGINDGCAYFFIDDIYNATPAQSLNTIAWAVCGPSTGAACRYPTMSPVEAKGIDDKIDDGIANKGKFYGLDTASQAVGTGATIANSCRTSGVYNTNETLTCRTVYYLE